MATTLPIAAGLIVRAKDTGRVLMVQRSIDNKGYSAGQWEIPGGKLDGDDTPQEAAEREWQEEVGIDLPKGKIKGSYTTQDGKYMGFVYLVKHETDIQLADTRSSLDSTGDSEIENIAWWDLKDIPNNPAFRVEMENTDWATVGHAKAYGSGAIMVDIDGTADAAVLQFCQMLSAFREAGNFVALVTGDEEGTADQDVWNQKYAYVQQLGLSDCWDELVVVSGNIPAQKAAWCKANNVSIAYDNNIANAKALIAAGVPMVLVPWATRVKS